MTKNKLISKSAVAVITCCLAFGIHAEQVTIKTVGSGYRTTPPAEIPGFLEVPSGEKLPAVVIVHGSAGRDTRGTFHAEALNAAGIATIEIDMWTPRGVAGLNNRPPSALETMPDVWGAYQYLKNDPRFDPKRIGILGFSWGGVGAMGVSFGVKPKNPPSSLKDAAFNAVVAFYPNCDAWVKGGVGDKMANLSHPISSPVLIEIGTKDDYETSSTTCEQVKADRPNLNLTVKYWEGATHAFDMRDGKTRHFYDKLAKRRKGSDITISPNKEIGEEAREVMVQFFKSSFGM